MWDRHRSGPHPQVHCFDTSFLKTVLYCFYCLILMEALYVFVFTRFRLCLCCPTVLKGYKDHVHH